MYRSNGRLIKERIFQTVMYASCIFVVAVFLSMIAVISVKGAGGLSLKILLNAPQGGYSQGGDSGGILNAILGSIYLALGATFLAGLVSVPVSLFLNVYLKKSSKLATFIRFSFDVLWGIPSIVYGAFGFMIMVLFHIRASLFAGILTIALLELPIMTRAADSVLKMVPAELKDISLSLGATRLETAFRVVFKQALPGIVTAILIGFGRGIGDAAAVLLTTGYTDSLPSSLFRPVATLPLAIFFQLGTPFPEVRQMAYTSALVLMLVILSISVLGRMFTKRFHKHILR